jgi:ATP-dependent RNA helicase HelY
VTDRESVRDLSSVFGFSLDAFQMKAIHIIDEDESVVVSAPTGSGKTVIAEYGIMRALANVGRSFYTTPIKALSNQKFNDLVAMFGREKVGLLTGDNVINADAPIVVMTTEVLRNMLYARSDSLSNLSTVVLDEVHFIQDAYRGPVWEEVIIHLPPEVQLICLSATVSNAPEVAEWMTTVRGSTRYVVEDRRPVELEPLVMVSDRSGQDELLSIFSGSAINPRLLRLTESLNFRKGGKRPVGRRSLVTPRRSDVIDQLRQHDLLPTIYFIFSRQGCDEAAASAARELPSLTTPEQRRRIAEIVGEKVASLTTEDLEALGFEGFRLRLEAGIAAHHAGMVPPFKEIVEACFVEGLIRVVFATETLAVGINMPARSVVIDKLTKFTGEHHEFLSAAQFTQLTGRAGRRGLDDKGHAVLLWSPFVTMEQMAGLASSRSFRLTSSFRPTYNMAVNLVRSYSRETARHLLNLSLAQFQSDRDVVKLETRLDKKMQELRESENLLHSPHGTPDDFLALAASEDHKTSRKVETDIDKAISELRPGAVIHVHKGNFSGMSAVLSTTRRAKGWKVTVLTSRRSLLQLTSDDFTERPTPVLSIELPQPFTPTRQDFQKKTVDRMSRTLRKRNIDSLRPRRSEDTGTALSRLEVELRMDEDFEQRIIAARRVLRLRKEVPHIQDQVDQHTSSISRTFDRVLDILQSRDYVNNWSLTSKGEVLSRLFHESDLLIAECLHRGLLDELDAPSLSALTSVFVYEHRSSEPAPAPWFPSKDVRSRWREIESISSELRSIEIKNHLPPHRAPHPTFVSVAFSWAAGDGFSDIIIDEDLSGGDFVRTMKQLIDLLRQFGVAAPDAATRRTSTSACELLLRGVVRASSAFGETF